VAAVRRRSVSAIAPTRLTRRSVRRLRLPQAKERPVLEVARREKPAKPTARTRATGKSAQSSVPHPAEDRGADLKRVREAAKLKKSVRSFVKRIPRFATPEDPKEDHPVPNLHQQVDRPQKSKVILPPTRAPAAVRESTVAGLIASTLSIGRNAEVSS
jgi:hypothetical protein